jgi:pimeloyl-ACP methyl ester carboxylesterase
MALSPITALSISPGSPRQTGSDWGEQSSFQFEGWQCHWRQLGPTGGEPLVLLHGFGASSGHWRANAGGLADAGFCVFAIDLLGFGLSDQPGIALDNRLWSRQLQHFLRLVVGRPAVLVGNSIGGLVALTTAVFAPQLVQALVAAPLPDPTLLSPMASRSAPWKRRLQRWLVQLFSLLAPLRPLIALLRQPALLRLGIASAYAKRERIDAELVRLIQRPAARPSAARALAGMVRGMGLRPAAATAPRLLPRLQLPLLLLWGSQDRLVPPLIAQRVMQHSPAGICELRWLTNLGHCPHDEDPQRFNQLLIEWLRRNTAST